MVEPDSAEPSGNPAQRVEEWRRRRCRGTRRHRRRSDHRATVERFYQRFKWSVIAPISADRWPLDAGDVLDWLESAEEGTDDVVRLAVKES